MWQVLGWNCSLQMERTSVPLHHFSTAVQFCFPCSKWMEDNVEDCIQQQEQWLCLRCWFQTGLFQHYLGEILSLRTGWALSPPLYESQLKPFATTLVGGQVPFCMLHNDHQDLNQKSHIVYTTAAAAKDLYVTNLVVGHRSRWILPSENLFCSIWSDPCLIRKPILRREKKTSEQLERKWEGIRGWILLQNVKLLHASWLPWYKLLCKTVKSLTRYLVTEPLTINSNRCGSKVRKSSGSL